jgi:hypothetical protein
MPPHQGMMGAHQNFRAEYREHYDKLGAADKEKVRSIHRQIASLRKQEFEILGMTPPWERHHGPSSGTTQNPSSGTTQK